MSRTWLLAATAALALGTAPAAVPAQTGEQGAARAAIEAAVAAPTRSAENRARDVHRHPVETLAFFEVKPTDTVLEFNPGGGWYTEILAPYLAARGKLYGTQGAGRYLDRLKEKLAADPATYGKVTVLPWPPTSDALPDASVDKVLTFRNVHNLIMAGGTAAQDAFATFHRVLKPGGVLGVVDHRLPEDRPDAAQASSGYVKRNTIVALAEKAGFRLAAESEVNANPKDTADWEKGVWTLPPTLRAGEVDREKYLAIGESDRMTLKFVKP